MESITLEFSIEELQILNMCLVKAPVPYENVAPLIDHINKQLNKES